MKTRGAIGLRRYREANGLSQLELATLIGVSQPTVSHYESGAKRPEDAVRAVIEARTAGAVKANSWRTRGEQRRIDAAAGPSRARPAA